MKVVLILVISMLTFYGVTPQVGSIKVHIKGIESATGSIGIGLYNKKEGFAEYDKRYKGIFLKASQDGVTYVFENLPLGKYAIAVFHDENNNEKIDKSWLGVPTESYGFSLNKYGVFGPPKFEDVSFKIEANSTTNLTITLK